MSNNLHPKNKHKSSYNLENLCEVYPELEQFVFINKYESKTIDFSNPKAVKALNTALLFKYYGVKFWEFPDDNLCPPIPGRIDYIHHLSDLLKTSNLTENISVLDIGTGASCIYPILGYAEYGWRFTGTDIDKTSLKYAQGIVNKNNLNNYISLRHQKDSKNILKSVISNKETFSVSMCNPPFYKSEQEAVDATTRKLKGLNKDEGKLVRNFAGTNNELWYKGGEKAFLHNYLYESSLFKEQCHWFSSLVSKKELVRGMKVSLKKLNVKSVKVINMGHGNKQSRIVAWSFID